jgi:hypothetical protein
MTDSALLLIARAEDPAIAVLKECGGDRVLHADMADLTRSGWRYVGGHPELATACVGGRVIRGRDSAAVICRISRVTADDLPHVHAEDRSYAAAESTAFLCAWLAQFEGIRCNEPTWLSLAGPRWHVLQWQRLLSKLDVPTARDQALGERESCTAIIAGAEVIGVSDPQLIEYSLRIARAFRSRWLSICFVNDRGWKVYAIDSCPQVDGRTARALLDYLLPRKTFESRPKAIKEVLCAAN